MSVDAYSCFCCVYDNSFFLLIACCISQCIIYRYIPDDMTFDQEPKSEATQMPDATSYKPTLFTNAALNQSKVGAE